jgi:hypothetical protein
VQAFIENGLFGATIFKNIANGAKEFVGMIMIAW